MLRKLALHGVGPAADLAMDPVAERLNVLTGDNGLGKSFLLETAWWSLTRTWHETPAVPFQPDAKINHHFDGATTHNETSSTWDRQSQEWKREVGKPSNPGLVMYARVDGSFSVWDPARNYRRYRNALGGEGKSPPAYQFTHDNVLKGLTRTVESGGQSTTESLCHGLLRDWQQWQLTKDPKFELLRDLLSHLSPKEQRLDAGELLRASVDNVDVIPTIRMPYAQDVPITYAPAGVRRMCKLAYLLAWSFAEHHFVSERIGLAPSEQMILLVDEIETHLHPQWQRTVLPSLLKAIENAWPGVAAPKLQLLVATHSPLVMTSVEAMFDEKRDALWKLDLVDGEVTMERDAWHKRGDVGMWLASDVFDETNLYSIDAQKAMERAAELMQDDAATEEQARQQHENLARVLADTDPFWLHWRAWKRSRGWAS